MKTKKSSMQFLQKHLTLKLLMFIYVHTVTADVSSVFAGNNTVLDCEHEPGNLTMATWKVYHVDRAVCYMSHSVIDNQTFNGCNNRIHLDIGVNRVSLRIDNSTVSDEGKYICEIVNATGTFCTTLTLQVLVKPFVLIKPNRYGFPECQAIGGKPAANISWISTSYHEVHNTNYTETNGTTTVISTYNPKGVDVSNATCIVAHPTFTNTAERSITMSVVRHNNIWWVFAAIPILVLAVGMILFWQRSNLRSCLSIKTNTPVIQENPTVTIEEVEPYASFTQKVNAIYNSTSELSESKEKNLSQQD